MEQNSKPLVPRPPLGRLLANKIDKAMAMPVIDENIADVDKTFLPYAWKYFNKPIIVGAVVLGTWLVFWLYYYLAIQPGFGENDGWQFFIPLLVAGFFYAYVREEIKSQFYRQFAQANGFSYTRRGYLPGLNGSLFNIGRPHKPSNIVTGKFADHPISLFNYAYTVGSGKHSTTYRATVLEISHDHILPPLLLTVDWVYWGGLRPVFPDAEKVPVEEGFEKHFNLYTQRKFEIEALQVFTPDFMELYQDRWNQLSLDFVDSKIFIYTKNHITKKDILQNMYELAQHLIIQLEPVLAKMQSGLKEMNEAARKKEPAS